MNGTRSWNRAKDDPVETTNKALRGAVPANNNTTAHGTVESACGDASPRPRDEHASQGISSFRGFFRALFSAVGNTVLDTIKRVLIIGQNTAIYGMFLLGDFIVHNLIKFILAEELKNPTVSSVFQWIYIVSAIIIGSSYVVRLAVELIRNRGEYLGIPQHRRGTTGNGEANG